MHSALLGKNFVFPTQQIVWTVYFPAFGDNTRPCTRSSEGNGSVERKADAYPEAMRKFSFSGKQNPLRMDMFEGSLYPVFSAEPCHALVGCTGVLTRCWLLQPPCCSHSLPLLVFHLLLVDPS